jgi:hypothetical protein
MAELWITAWFVYNWKLIASIAIILSVIYSVVKFNDSFDEDPKISSQEKLKAGLLSIVIFISIVLSTSLVVSFFL